MSKQPSGVALSSYSMRPRNLAGVLPESLFQANSPEHISLRRAHNGHMVER